MARLNVGIGWLVAPTVVLLLMVGCGGGSSDGGSSSDGGGNGNGEGSVLLDLLGTIPDTPETRELLVINDYARARRIQYPTARTRCR